MRRAWLQKHPTPDAPDGAFHWYPAGVDAELRAGFAERLAGITVPVLLWHHAPGRVAWASAFAATAPRDGRKYVGLALVVADGPGTPADLLASLAPPLAAPWLGELPPPFVTESVYAIPDPAAVARALLASGSAGVGDVAQRGLPRAVAAIERVLPASVVDRPRAGAWTEGVATRAPDRVAELAAAAATAPRSHAATAWRLLVELAATTGRDVDALAVDATRPDDGWLGTLNAWGRDRLDCDVDTLADRVALRMFAHLAADRDPRAAIAEVRWRALLPAARRAELLTAVAKRTRRFVDA